MNNVEISQGEIKVNFKEPKTGKVSFSDLGISDESKNLEGGLLRLVFDLRIIKHGHLCQEFRLPFQLPSL